MTAENLLHSFVAGLAVALAFSLPAATAAEPPPGAMPLRIFDGREKQLVLVKNSHGCQNALTARLKKMPGAEKIHFSTRDGASFHGKVGGAAPSWCPKEPLPGEPPVIYIIQSAADSGIGKSGETTHLSGPLQRTLIDNQLASMRHEVECAVRVGIGLVLLANTHYNRDETHRGGPGGLDGSDAIVAAWNKTDLGQKHPAVDVRTTTRQHYPAIISSDLYHPGDAGRELVAHLYFAALCAHDGLQVPPWSMEMVTAALEREKKQRSAMQLTSPGGGGKFHVGDKVKIAWQSDPQLVTKVRISFSPRLAMYYAPVIAEVESAAGEWIWTIPPALKDSQGRDFPTPSTNCHLRIEAIGAKGVWTVNHEPFIISE